MGLAFPLSGTREVADHAAARWHPATLEDLFFSLEDVQVPLSTAPQLVELAANYLGLLRATAGTMPTSRAVLRATNRIAAAVARRQLLLNELVIPRLRTHLAGSAQLTRSPGPHSPPCGNSKAEAG